MTIIHAYFMKSILINIIESPLKMAELTRTTIRNE